MKSSLAILFFLAASLAASAQPAMPRLTGVDPDSGKAGDVITAAGEHLDKAVVAKLYLTDGKNDVPVEITDQTATAIKFKIPAKAAPGRLTLMFLTTGKEPKLIEQPVKLVVEEGS